MSYAIGDKVKVSEFNDNENYKDFKNKTLIITNKANEGRGYDEELYPQFSYSFEFEDGTLCPFSLYHYELEEA